MTQFTSQQAERNDPHQRNMAPPGWDDENGAGTSRKKTDAITSDELAESAGEASPELVQLRIRVIALENLLIALLAGGSKKQLALARSLTTHISPRPGFTYHRLTLHAASQMRRLLRRAGFFRDAALVDQRGD